MPVRQLELLLSARIDAHIPGARKSLSRMAAGVLICATASVLTIPANDSVSAKVPTSIQMAPVIAVAPAGPSAYQLELQMSGTALIARWNPIIAEAAKRFGVPEEWIRAVMRAESGGRTQLAEGQPIVSSAGAMGLMQVMPDTYALLRNRYGLGDDAFDPHDNILAGTAYLKWLHDQFGNPGMFAAYNAGPGRLIAYVNDGKELPDETRAYVVRIARVLDPGKSDAAIGTTHLTSPDGSPIAIDARTITAIRAALPDEFAPGVQTVLKIGNRIQGVRESVTEAEQAVRASRLTL